MFAVRPQLPVPDLQVNVGDDRSWLAEARNGRSTGTGSSGV